MQAELTALTAVLEKPTRPVLALIGGAKVSTKLDLLRFLIDKVDILVVGGAMANTFLFAEGREIGRSLCERDMADRARQILALARQRNCRVILPEDAAAASTLEPGVAARTVGIEAVPGDMMILDIGPKTVTHITAVLEEARTLVWNGPLGAFETPPFDRVRLPWRRRSASSAAPESYSVWPAAATRSRLSPWLGLPTSCPMSQLRAALFSNGWKAANCPGSRLWLCLLQINEARTAGGQIVARARNEHDERVGCHDPETSSR